MEIIASGRRTGKTTKLIEKCAAAEKEGLISYIVCSSNEEARRIANQAEQMGLFIAYPVTYSNFMDSWGRSHNIFIDNIELLLEFLGQDIMIAAATINSDLFVDNDNNS